MMRMKKLACGVASSALVLALASAVSAQETTSAIRGQVADDAGQPVAAAQITILHVPSGTRSVVSSDDTGVFDARGLRVGGPFEITVEAADYEAETLQGVNLTLGETLRLNLELVPAGTVAAVTVTAQRDPTADNSGVASTLTQDDIQGVVSVQRDIRDLARRNLLTSQNTRGDGGISIAGSNPRTNRITIDGAQAQDEFGLNTGGLPTRRGPISLDAVEQFTVDAVPVDVENGNFLGGALNVVLRSGGNAFEGSAFVNYLNDGLVGDSVRGERIATQITQQNYGGFFSGPILRDRLFFAFSYEKYESAEATGTGPTGAGFANSILNVTQADIDRVTGIFESAYATEFDVGTIPRTTPILDEKYSAKIDFNINDNHRASFTQRYALSELFSRTGLGRQSAGLSSQYYLTGEEDYSYTAELNSDWTNNFSSQIRITHRDLERRQDPPSGQEFAQITVCLAPTSLNSGGDTTVSCGANSVLTFGPDRFRQANFLETANTAISAKGEYSLTDHLLKFGYEGRKQDIFNIFVPGSDGVYYFDSVADFQAGRANRFEYNNAVSGNALDAAADFAFFTHSLYAQDTLEISERLRITGGARFDFYNADDQPILNPNFVTRQGFSNQETYDGRSVLMPRGSIEYEPTDWIDIRAGAGLFSGGVPNVIISNSFSNTGILTAGIDIRRNPNGTFGEFTNTPGFTQTVGATALNINRADPRFGYDIPSLIQQFQGGAIVSPSSETNAILPSFQLPSDWKYFLSAGLEAPEGWASGFAPELVSRALDNWRLTFDGVVTRVNNGLLFRDFRAEPLVVRGVQQFTPDGRIRYDGIGGTAAVRAANGIQSTNPGSNRDIIALNTDFGRSYTAGLSLNRRFDNGLEVLVGYARQDIQDQTSGARFASTASSLYGTGPAAGDPNEEAEGTSFEEIKNRYKFEIGYRRDFIRSLETRFNLFGEVRSGRPISFVMSDVQFGRGSTFGVNRGNHLLYVPDFRADANPNDLNVGFVTFDNVNTLNNFRNAVELFGLPQGRSLEKGEGSDDNPEIYQVDLQLSQELPGVFRNHRTRLTFDLQNVLNLFNDEWGLVEEYADTNRVVSVTCATSTDGAAAPTGSPVCDRYRYSNFNSAATRKDIDINGRSVWQLQIGLKYEF